MLGKSVSKVIFVDSDFIENVKQLSVSDYVSFTKPELDTQLVYLPLKESDEEEITRWIDPCFIKVGAVVVKPNYTDQYVQIDTFSKDIIKEKFLLFSRFCFALGAKKVSISSVEQIRSTIEDQNDVNVNISGQAQVVGAEIEASKSKSSKSADQHNSIMKLNTEATGGEPNFESAEDMIRRYRLQQDTIFLDILNLRREKNNNLISRDWTLDFSKDVEKVFDSSMLSKIDVIAKIYKGSIGLEIENKSIQRSVMATNLNVTLVF